MALWRYALIELADEVVELHTREAAELAVRLGRLTGDTPVVLYDEEGVPISARAGELDQFADLPGLRPVAEPAPSAPATKAAPGLKSVPLTASVISIPPAQSKAKAGAPWLANAPSSQTAPSPAPAPTPAPASTPIPAAAAPQAPFILSAAPPAPAPVMPKPIRPQSSGCLPLLVVAVLGLLLYAFVAMRPDPEPAGISAWTRREASIFAGARGTTVGTLARGKALRVSTAPGEPAWRIITEGQFAGRFIATDDVSNIAPPGLDTAVAGRWRLSRRAAILDAPDGRQLQNAPRGTRVRVVGRLQDQPQWLELALQSGGIGYVSSSSVRGIPPVAEAKTAPTPVQPTARPSNVAAPSKTDACASLISAAARARCRWPAARRADRNLVQAYAAATSRGADPGPIETWRGELEACGDEQACVLARYRDRHRAVTAMAAPVTTPAAPPVRTALGPSGPRLRTRSWLSGDDYPATALRAGLEGRTSFVASVDSSGRVTGCAVVASSGSADLDATTCRALRSRARFDPARDEVGNPVSSTYSSSVQWQIPR